MKNSGDRIMRDLLVVGISGGSASGKSTFSKKLVETLDGFRVKELHMDDYFRPEEERPFSEAPVAQKSYVDDNHPQTINLKKLNMDIDQAINCDRFEIIIIEGLLTLWDKEIYNKLDLKLFVDCQADERIVRRLQRNMSWGLSFDEISSVYLDLVRYRHNEYVEPTKWKADLIINGSTPSEKALNMVSNYIKSTIRVKDPYEQLSTEANK